MTPQFVVALYESKGYAQDARNRLHTEGVSLSDISVVVLHDIAPVPASTSETELAALSVSPFILGDVQDTFAQFIKNGETAVIVTAATAADVDFASDILALFDPVAIEVLQPRTARGAR